MREILQALGEIIQPAGVPNDFFPHALWKSMWRSLLKK